MDQFQKVNKEKNFNNLALKFSKVKIIFIVHIFKNYFEFKISWWFWNFITYNGVLCFMFTFKAKGRIPDDEGNKQYVVGKSQR